MTVKYTITPDELEYIVRMLMDILSQKNHKNLE